MAISLYLFDDRRARAWAPHSLTRPCGELLHGCLTARQRAELIFGVKCRGHISRTALIGFDEPGAPPAIARDDIASSGTRILISSRAVVSFQEFDLPTKSARICIDGDPVGWVLASGDPIPSELWLRNPEAEPSEAVVDLDLRGSILNHPWDLLAANHYRITDDIRELFSQDHLTPGAHRVGVHHVSLGEEAIIEAGVHLDLRSGPIRIDSGVRVEGPARLKGPLYVGQDSTILGGSVGASSIGPMCRVRGEVADLSLIHI